ncbi:sigma 54-interacting transcriptional regulator [Peribacillus frigoritolerans]|nr:sigma 54-interacting transcriptional regulator [Peribacillus frigoritolerans]
MESELFGYEPGASTGSLKNGKMGIFEKVNGGTLFLDENWGFTFRVTGETFESGRRKQVYESGFYPKMKEVDVRLITATHRDLASLVQEGSFREDLYYRLNIVSFEVPPLRQRKEETIPLLEMYLKKIQ